MRLKEDHHGHRKRVKDKFLKDSSNFADYELLELLLFSSHSRKDVKQLAKKLLAEFGSINSILKANSKSLRSFPDINDNVLVSLKLIKEIMAHSSKQQMIDKPIIASWKQLCDYCQIVLANLQEEQFRVLFLDKNNHLIVDELIKKGEIENVDIDIKTIVKKSLNFFATSIILLHNHPNLDCQPSLNDIANTKIISNTLQDIGIKVYDHLIVDKDGQIFSFKNEGLL